MVTIRISSGRSDPLQSIGNPMSFFETESVPDNPDIVLNVSEFVPDTRDCRIVDHKYHVRQNYLFCTDNSNGRTFKLEISGFETGRVSIRFAGSAWNLKNIIAPNLLPFDSALLPMIQSVLARKSMLLVHACGICDSEGRAHIFVGRSGTQKTSLAMLAVKRGYRILGDDRIILDLRNRKVMSFPIFSRVVETVEKIGDLSTNSELQRIRTITGLLFTKKPPNVRWQTDPCTISSIAFLNRTLRHSMTRPEFQRIDTDRAALKIEANNRAEHHTSYSGSRSNYSDFLAAYEFALGRRYTESDLTERRELVINLLNLSELCEIDLPLVPNPEYMETLLGWNGSSWNTS